MGRTGQARGKSGLVHQFGGDGDLNYCRKQTSFKEWHGRTEKGNFFCPGPFGGL